MNQSISKYDKLFNKSDKAILQELGFRLETELKWFEKKTLNYLFIYFQKGNFLFIDNIIKYSDFEIDNIPINDMKELVELTFLKFLSQKVSYFKDFLIKWSQRIVINSLDQPIVLNNYVEGKVLWKETFRERNFLPYPKSVKFVCISNKRNFDSLENILIKSFLDFLNYLFEKYKTYLNLSLKSKTKEEDWRFHALTILITLKKILKNFYIREITLRKNEWKNIVVLNSAIRSCYKSNYMLLYYANFYNDLVSFKNQKLFERFLIEYLIKPNEHKTAELFILFTLIEKISSLENIKESLYLIYPKSGKNYIYKCIFNNEMTIKVYYQKKPNCVRIEYPKESQFINTINYFNLTEIELHTDITIFLKHRNKKKIILIEVKNSSNIDYIREGLLQICNYYDFLMRFDNSNWTPFRNTAFYEKKGFLIARDIPFEWKNTISGELKDYEINILDFNKFSNLNIKDIIKF